MVNLFFFVLLPLVYGELRCPTGLVGTRDSGFCYQLMSTPATWPEAETNCTKLGGHLPTIDNANLNGILQGAAQLNNPITGFWIGYNNYLNQNICEATWADGRNTTYGNFGGNIVL